MTIFYLTAKLDRATNVALEVQSKKDFVKDSRVVRLTLLQ